MFFAVNLIANTQRIIFTFSLKKFLVDSWMEERQQYGSSYEWEQKPKPFLKWRVFLLLFTLLQWFFFFFLEKKHQNSSLLLNKVKYYNYFLNLAWLLGVKTVLRALQASLLGSLLFQFQIKFNYKGKLDFSHEYFLVIIFLM